ncbi:MAG: hypothetical protein N3E41_08605 [Thermofilaceae archaeon]|nr:hypothetical protein [Thermofilaceae archaeon]
MQIKERIVFLSILSQLHPSSFSPLRLFDWAFNSFPVASQPNVDEDVGQHQPFNSFPVASLYILITFSCARTILSILSQLHRRTCKTVRTTFK